MAGAIWTIGTLALLSILLSSSDFVLSGFTRSGNSRAKVGSLGDFSSNFWLALIVVGAVLAATGNVFFNVARDREKGERASAKAMGMLHAEINRNLRRVSELRQILQTGNVATASLEMTAWNVVATGGLLAQMDQSTLSKVADAYHLVGQAETYRSEIVSRSTGITQALGGSSAITTVRQLPYRYARRA